MTNIIGIGSRAAGLSTYLATLAYHQKHQVKSKKVLSCQVTPINEDTKQWFFGLCYAIDEGYKG
jgi:hypothetical protein